MWIVVPSTSTLIISNDDIMAQQNEPPSLPLPSMDLPYSTSTVFFKIGSNLDPFLFLQLNLEMRQAVTISFEPMIVGCKITPHKQLMLCWIPPRQQRVCMSKIISASRHPSPRLQSRFSGIQDKIMEWCMCGALTHASTDYPRDVSTRKHTLHQAGHMQVHEYFSPISDRY